MRTQYCREHLTPEVAEACNIDKQIVIDTHKAATFCDAHSEFSQFGTDSILTLMVYPDATVRDNAILSIKKSLDLGKSPLTGKILKVKRLTTNEVKKVLEKEEIELRGEIVKKIKQEKKVEPVAELGIEPKTELISIKPESAPAPAPVLTPAKFTAAPIISQDPDKQRRAEKYYHADELLERMPASTKVMVTEIIQEHRDWKAADVFYYGVQALAESKKKR